MRLQKKERQHRRLDKAHNCIKPNVGKGENYNVDPVTGEIQLRLPLPVNETQSEINSQLAPTVAIVATAVVPTAELPKGPNDRSLSMTSMKPSEDSSSTFARPSTHSHDHSCNMISTALSKPSHATPSISRSCCNGPIPLATKKRSRTIPSAIRHAVWLHDHG
jgi:hypothetical protein